jgi:hypothetical protein
LPRGFAPEKETLMDNITNATPTDMKKHLEAILGHKLIGDLGNLEAGGITLTELVASSAVSSGENTVTTQRSIIPGTRPNVCRPARLLDVSGVAATGSNGQSLVLLNDFICPGKIFQLPVNVVATPLSSTPCFLTVIHSLVTKVTDGGIKLFGADVEIKVFAWDASGAAAQNVAFDWRCRVAFVEPIS